MTKIISIQKADESNDSVDISSSENTVLAFAEHNESYAQLKNYLTDNTKEKINLNFSDDAIDFEKFNDFLDFVKNNKLNINFVYLGENSDIKEQVQTYNTRLDLAYDLSATEYKFFDIALDKKSNHVFFTLKNETTLEFDKENEAYGELKTLLSKLTNGNHATIQYEKNAKINFDKTSQLIDDISTKQKALKLDFKSTDTPLKPQLNVNSILADYYLYAARKINPESGTKVDDLFTVRKKGFDKKIRRAKQMLNRGMRIQTQHQHQHHHQHAQSIEQTKEKQKQQQNQQQQFQTRQNQVQQQQSRMQNMNQQLAAVSLDSLGKLIHEDNLSDLVTPQLKLEDIKTIWTNLVGAHARHVDKPENKITHVSADAMRFILNHKEQFSYGIHFEDLPNGFGFTVHQPQDNKSEPKSILYFKQDLVKTHDKRHDSFLAPRIEDGKKAIESFGGVGQFFPFFKNSAQTVEQYHQFIKNNKKSFDPVFYPQKKTKLDERITALVDLLILDKPELAGSKDSLQELLKGYTHQNINGLRTILHEKGADGVINFLQKTHELQQAGQYKLFKELFLESSEDWRALVETQTTRPDELDAAACMDYLCKMPAQERLWWESMAKQHLKANGSADLIDLVNAHNYFFEQLKKFQPPVTLPAQCPLENIQNLKTAYARLLYLFNKSIDPHQQAEHLDKLDFGMQGFICGASRNGPYVFITKEMDIIPTSGMLDWNKYRKHLPNLPTGSLIEQQPEKGKDYTQPTDEGLELTPYVKYPSLKTKWLGGLALDGRYAHIETITTKLTREDGFIVLKTESDSIAAPSQETTKKIDDPEAQDEGIMTKLNRVDYAIDMDTLADLSQKLHYFGNLTKFYYRFIGTQNYAFNFATYRTLAATLSTESLIPQTEEPSTDRKKEEDFAQKQLLVLLALCTTGPRALQQGKDVEKELEHFLETVRQKNLLELLAVGVKGDDEDSLSSIDEDEDEDKSLPFQNGLLQHIIQHYRSIEPRPTLSELSSLLNLAVKINQGELSTVAVKNTFDLFLKKVQTHGESVYEVIANLAEHDTIPSQAQLGALETFLNTIENKEPAQKASLMHLASLIHPDEWNNLEDLTTHAASIKHPEIWTHLKTVLTKVNHKESELIRGDDLTSLFGELNKISDTEKNPYTAVFAVTVKSLPKVKFNDITISQTTLFLVRVMAQFAEQLSELSKTLDNQLDNLDATIDKALNSELQSQLPLSLPIDLKKYKEPITTWAKTFIGDLKNEINTLQNVTAKINGEESADNVAAVLKQIDKIIKLFEDPFKDFTLGNIVLDNTVLPILKTTLQNLVIKPAKDQVLKLISTHLLDALRLQITEKIKTLQINGAVLDKDAEKNISLSAQLSEFLQKQIKPLSGKELTKEINDANLQHDLAQKFLDALEAIGKGPRRDELLAFLYRQKYFNTKKSPTPPLEDLTKLIDSFKACKNIDIAQSFTHIFAALNKGKTTDNIQPVVNVLTAKAYLLNNDEFQSFLQLALTKKQGLALTQRLLSLKKELSGQPTGNEAYHLLYQLAATDSIDDTPAVLKQFANVLTKNNKSILADYINTTFKDKKGNEAQQAQDELQKMLQMLEGFEDTEQRHNVLVILNAAHWQRSGELASLKEQEDLIDTLTKKLEDDEEKFPNGLKKLAQLYQNRPCPPFSTLREAANKDDFDLDKWIRDSELDPCGNRQNITSQYELRGADTFVSEIKDLISGEKLDGKAQQTLVEGFGYVLAVANQHGLLVNNQIKPVSQIKPVRAFTRKELSDYYQQCVKQVKDNPNNMRAKYEGLAILCEVMFRTTGKFPYHSQIICALETLNGDDSTLMQIPTGQGKSITLALIAALNYSFGQGEQHVTVSSRNKLLAGRDYKESIDFYNYLNIPTAFVKASTEENHYKTRKIIYTTLADQSLYESRLELIDGDELPAKDQRVFIGDEVDADFFDNKNAFNFSEGTADPYTNPLEWVYPLANEYIKTDTFKSESNSREADIVLFKGFLKEKSADEFNQFAAILTDSRLDQFLDSACSASQLQENLDFVIRRKTRMVYGVEQEISEAHVLVNHYEDKEATLSYGVQQALHARLNQEYKTDIDKYKNNDEEGRPPFSCDNQIDCIDSKNAHSHFQKFKRHIGATGTAGTIEELREVRDALNIKKMLNIPPRRKSRLEYLSTVFCDDRASFFFGPDTQLNSIQRMLKKSRNQPVMISCASIDKANELYQQLEKKYHDNVQVIHAENAENPKQFEDMVDKAAIAGKITIVTPLAGRGVDIKTKAFNPEKPDHLSKAQQKIDKLAENLLVIETHLDRHRNRRQLQGRSARDGKSGQTVGIFNMSDIFKEHGIKLNKKSRQEKLKALDELMDKMDSEASIERHIFLKVRGIITSYQAVFDQWLKENGREKDDIEQIKSAKSRFIEQCEQKWNELLADSDPQGEFPNPYVRYDKKSNLKRDELEELVNTFEKAVGKDKNNIMQKCMNDIDIQGLQLPEGITRSFNYTPNIDEQQDATVKNETSKNPAEKKTLTDYYLDIQKREYLPPETTQKQPSENSEQSQQQQIEISPEQLQEQSQEQSIKTPEQQAAVKKFNYYQEMVNGIHFLKQRIDFWISGKQKIQDSIMPSVKNLQDKLRTNIIETIETDEKNIQNIHGVHHTFLTALTHALNDKTIDTKQITALLPYCSLAIIDTVENMEIESPDDEKTVCQATVGFLQEALKAQLTELKDGQDKAKLLSLQQSLTKFNNSITQLTDLHHIVTPMITLTRDDVKSPELKAYLGALKQTVNAVAFKNVSDNKEAIDTSAQNGTDKCSRRDNEFKVMVWEIKDFLEKTKSRIDKNNNTIHRHNQTKVDAIDTFITQHCSDDGINTFLTNKNDASLQGLLDGFVSQVKGQNQTLENILAINTKWGANNGLKKTTSTVEFAALKKRFALIFDMTQPTTEQSSSQKASVTKTSPSFEDKSKAVSFKNELEAILKRLTARQGSASGLLKDAKAYKMKVEKLTGYIEKIKDLLKYKESNGIKDFESEIKDIQLRVQTDADIYSNTSRFFGQQKNVTVVNEIEKTTSRFSPK